MGAPQKTSFVLKKFRPTAENIPKKPAICADL
jgi:hypothetical protein